MSQRASVVAPRRVKRMVVATDFSECAPAVLEQAVAWGRIFDASVDLVHVREPFVFTLTEGFIPSEEQRAELTRWIDERLAEMADQVTHAGLPCMTNSLDGVPHTEIVKHARKTGADLIVLGAHGRGGFAHAVLGSVAERVVQRAGCPVLVVPTPPSERERAG